MEKKHQENSRSPRKRIINFLVHVLLAVLALIWALPVSGQSRVHTPTRSCRKATLSKIT